MTNDSSRDRRIDYIEFPVTDVPAAKRFYGQAFGWTFEDYGPDYASFRDGRLDGGFRKEAAVVTGGPLVVLYARDLEGMAQAIGAAGGRIIRPIFSFPGGRRFHFTDPSGNELAVWSE
jgi:predicted enzyme related to lactoylglutathione lyase